MIAGFHLIFTAYGWWLPNDPRGSMSTEIRVERLTELGPAHYGRKKVQPPSRELREFYEKAGGLLHFPLLTFDQEDRDVIARAFAQVIVTLKYTCYACAIMPEHVHVLIRKHRDHAEQMIAKLQQASRGVLLIDGHHDPQHPVWGGPGWRVFLNTPDDFWRTVRYIENNPRKAGLPDQRWGFVKPYDGWMPGNPREVRS